MAALLIPSNVHTHPYIFMEQAGKTYLLALLIFQEKDGGLEAWIGEEGKGAAS